MYDVEFDEFTVYFGCQAINTLRSRFDDFSSRLNSTTINCSELSKAFLLNESKSIVNSYNSVISDIEQRGQNLKNTLIAINPSSAGTFALIESYMALDIGDFTDGDMNFYQSNDDNLIFEDGNQQSQIDPSLLVTPEKILSEDRQLLYKGGKYKYFITGNVNTNSPLVIYNYGAGGNDGYYKKFMTNITNFYSEGETKFNNGIFMPFNPYNGNKILLMKELTKQLNEQYPGISGNVTTAGFSDGGQHAINQIAELARENPEIKSPAIVLVDAYTGKAYDNEDLKVLGEKDAVVFAIHNANYTSKDATYEKWAQDYGINVIKIEDNYCKMDGTIKDGLEGYIHQRVEKDYFDFDIPAFQTNQGTFPDETFTSTDGEVKDCYTATIFRSGTSGEQPYELGGKTIEQVYSELGLNYQGANSTVNNQDIVPQSDSLNL